MDVKEIQATLNNLGFRDKNGNRLAVDGIYGPLTDSAVRNFQRSAGIQVTGDVGPLTTAAFQRREPSFVGPGNTYKPHTRAQASRPVQSAPLVMSNPVPQPPQSLMQSAQAMSTPPTGNDDRNLWNSTTNAVGRIVNYADHMGVPIAGQIGTAWDIAEAGTDVINTFTADNDLTFGQRSARGGIQTLGAVARGVVGAVTTAIGSAGMAATVPTKGASLTLVPLSIYNNNNISREITRWENNWLDSLGLN